ncbi:MAG TPA: flagellar filament outer layer protein FlaA, partial [Spirochaetales bacterium]|nr:flagellar filament outer layer protein FlaA [Spirochaetales bacterium]
MKQRVVKAFSLLFVFLFLLCVAPAFGDEETTNLESLVVQDFDDPEAQPWFVIGSKFATAGYPKLNFVKTWPTALHGVNPEGKDARTGSELRSLGVAMMFDRKEYNWVDIIPGTKSGSGEDVTYQPAEIDLPGRVSQIDMWIWSGNYNYYIEAYIRDYTGIVHIVPMGNLNHIGWKHFRGRLPDNIPQARKYLPKRESLTLVKCRIWTRTTTAVARLPCR